MKIGIDARLWNQTGVGRYIRNVVTNLQDINSKNEYVLFVGKDFASSRLQVTSNNWKIVTTDIRWHTLREQISFSQILNNENLDLMHFPYFSLPIGYKKPFVVTIHDLILHEFSTGKASTLPMPLYTLKRLGFKKVFEHGLKHSQKIIVPLETVKTEIISRFSIDQEKVVVTKEGFDTALLQTGRVSVDVQKVTEAGNFFLYVGNAYPHKNMEFLIEGFLEFKKKYPEHTLVLAGRDDHFYKSLRRVTEDVSVVFMGEVSDSELGLLYREAEAFVSASFMEGFGLPPLEAMASGCIPLLSDIPAFHEVCGDKGMYFNPKSKQSLQDGLEEIHTLKKEELEKKRKAAKEHAGHYSWKKTAATTLGVYESCIGVR